MYNSRLIKNCQYIIISLIISGFLAPSAFGQMPNTPPSASALAAALKEKEEKAKEAVTRLVNAAAARVRAIMIAKVMEKYPTISDVDLAAATATIDAIITAMKIIIYDQIIAACNNAIDGISKCSTSAATAAAIKQVEDAIANSFIAAMAAGKINLGVLQADGVAALVRLIATQMLTDKIKEIDDKSELVDKIRDTIRDAMRRNNPELATGYYWQDRLGPAFPAFQYMRNHWWLGTPNAITLAEGASAQWILVDMSLRLDAIRAELAAMRAFLKLLIKSIKDAKLGDTSCINISPTTIAPTTVLGVFGSLRESVRMIEYSLNSLKKALEDLKASGVIDEYNKDPKNAGKTIDLGAYMAIINVFLNDDVADIKASLSNAETIQILHDLINTPKPPCATPAVTPPVQSTPPLPIFTFPLPLPDNQPAPQGRPPRVLPPPTAGPIPTTTPPRFRRYFPLINPITRRRTGIFHLYEFTSPAETDSTKGIRINGDYTEPLP